MPELTKAEFLTEIAARGAIDYTTIPTVYQLEEWYQSSVLNGVAYAVARVGAIGIANLTIRNPPTDVADIKFKDISYSDTEVIDKDWALAAINKLPFTEVIIPKTVIFESVPENATFACKSI